MLIVESDPFTYKNFRGMSFFVRTAPSKTFGYSPIPCQYSVWVWAYTARGHVITKSLRCRAHGFRKLVVTGPIPFGYGGKYCVCHGPIKTIFLNKSGTVTLYGIRRQIRSAPDLDCLQRQPMGPLVNLARIPGIKLPQSLIEAQRAHLESTLHVTLFDKWLV